MTVLLTLGVALIGVGGVALGAWLNQRGAAAVVSRTFAGQRLLARDAALREYRTEQITPYIEAARQRFRIWAALHAELGAADEWNILTLQGQLTDLHFNSLVVTYVEIPDDAFRSAFQQFVSTEGKFKSEYTPTEVMDRVKEMRLALVALSTAAERYVFMNESN